ncbi:MAG TPA: 30S ribosomal protein S20 [Dissulfurispiraceae bacterium]
MAKSAPKKNLSAEKRVRQAGKRQLHNQSVETAIKTHTKKLETAMSSGKGKDEIDAIVKKASSVINKAASKGIIHKNTASRKISRITRKANTSAK